MRQESEVEILKGVHGSPPLSAPSPQGVETMLSFDHLLAAFRRQRGVIALCIGLGAALGLATALTSTRLYTASASLIIDPPGGGGPDGTAASSERGLDTGIIDSQVEVLRSDRIAIAVATQLDLGNDPRFMDEPASLAGHLRGLLPRRPPEALSPEEETRQRLADILKEIHAGIWIDRIGESYVLKIDYTSASPALSADIANAYIDAYLQDQIRSRVEAAGQASAWLETRLADVRQQAFDADLAAQQFRAGGQSAPAGEPGQQGQDASARRIVQLRHLEREAETYRGLYQELLGRYQDSIQQQSFPTISARVVAPATPPLRPSQPRRSLVLALAIMAGAGAGIAVGALREMRDRSFRTATQLGTALGLPCLGTLPEIDAAPRRDAPPAPGSALVRQGTMRQVLDAPLSPFADALRGSLAAVEAWRGDRKPCAIGLISALPGEGCSTIAANLALLAASSGSRTLLVDGDLRQAGLSRAIAPAAALGLPEAASGPAGLERACLSDPETGLRLLPAMPGPRGGNALQPQTIRNVLEWSGPHHDYIFVDLPAIGRFSDARAVSRLLDGFLLVVRWGTTPRGLVGDLLAEDADLRRRIIGSLLNAADVRRMHLYADRNSADYHRSLG